MSHLFSPGIGIYLAHGAFWVAFAIARLIARASLREKQDGAAVAGRVEKQDSSPHARLMVGIHSVGFFILYLGVGDAVFGGHPAALFQSQVLVGAILIGCGLVLSCWTLFYFRSWRFQATLNVGHELATGGPFRFLRHPIYMALNLLALGTALWIPTLCVWLGFVCIALGSDLRARAEETLLQRNFGEQYAKYCSQTRRFVPLVY
jgi:protein-S-isoprenylcysteine O-methyltransferase Ste14